jgi:hypothetical protein
MTVHSGILLCKGCGEILGPSCMTIRSSGLTSEGKPDLCMEILEVEKLDSIKTEATYYCFPFRKQCVASMFSTYAKATPSGTTK